MRELLYVAWSGMPIRDEETDVVRNAACEYLRRDEQPEAGDTFRFVHPECDGILTYQNGGFYGAFPGDFFSADLGGGQTMIFFIPRGTEEIDLNEVVRIFRYKTPRQRSRGAGRKDATHRGNDSVH